MLRSSLAAGLLAGLQAWRLRHEQAAPAAEVALLLRRTAVALAFGAAAMLSIALFALESRGELARWYVLGAGIGGLALSAALAAVAATIVPPARLRPAVPGAAGDVFDDLPVHPAPPVAPLPRARPRRPRPSHSRGRLGGKEPRNAVLETVLVIAGFAALGRPLGLRGQSGKGAGVSAQRRS